MGSNPDHKKRADGGLLGGKQSQGQAKAFKAKGKLVTRHPEVGTGSKRLAGRRLWKWIQGDD